MSDVTILFDECKLTATDVEHARDAIGAGEQTAIEMARILKVGRNTLGRALQG